MRSLNTSSSNCIFSILLSLCMIQFANVGAYAGTKTVTVRCNESDLKFSKQGEYDVASLSESGFMREPSRVGEPMLPVKILRVLIPTGTDVKSIRVLSSQEKKIAGKYYICPIQPPVLTGDQPKREFVSPKQTVYGSKESYPGKLVALQAQNYFREYRIVAVAVYPLQYQPSTRTLSLSTEITFEVEYAVSVKYQFNPRLRQNERKQNEIKEHVKQLIVNPEDVSLNGSSKSQLNAKVTAKTLSVTTSPSATEGLDVEYVIITNDALASSFQRLADWKIKKGIVTTIKTVSWISQNYSGCDAQEKIRHFIQDAYIKWGTEYILLGGDVDVVPVRTVENEGCGIWEKIPTDLYYSAIDPLNDNWNADGDSRFGEYDGIGYGGERLPDLSDVMADIWVGRAPVHNGSEVNTFIDKVFTYERNSLAPGTLPSPLYLTKTLLLGGLVEVYYEDGTLEPWNGSALYTIDSVNDHYRMEWFTNYKMYEYVADYDAHYGSFFLPRNDVLTAQNAIREINNGYGIIDHIDHSNPQVMTMGSKSGGGSITNGDVDNLNNGNKYSIVVTGGCSPGAIDYDCIGEHFLQKSNGGAVAFIGASRANTVSGFREFDIEFFNSLFFKHLYNIGKLFGDASNSMPNGPWEFEPLLMNLLGDPEMPVWTDFLAPLNVSHPTSISTGPNNFAVTVNAPYFPAGLKVVVCLQKGIEEYAVQTLTTSWGPVTANFVITPNTTGTMTVTVKVDNFAPYEGTVSVTQSSGANLFVESVTTDDDMSGGSSGDGDGKIDAGETIQLPVTLKNSGATAANGVSASLTAYLPGTSTPHPSITITDGSATFGNIVAGGSVTCSDGFVFSVSKDFITQNPNEDMIEFRLAITDGASHNWSDKFSLQAGASKVQHTYNTVGQLQVNTQIPLVVQLSNYGNTVAKGITVNIEADNVTGNSYVDYVLNTNQNIGDINPNESKSTQSGSSGIFFSFSNPECITNPEHLIFLLTIQDAYGRVILDTFDLIKPYKPTGLRFRGYETAIDLIWDANPEPIPQGYNIFRCATLNGTYQKINNRLVDRVSYFKDIALQKETIYYYKVEAVDEGGTPSEMSDPLETWTTIGYVSNWPIRTDDHFFSSTTLFDYDNDGKMEIFTANTALAGSGNTVYAFRGTGAELFDIDFNVTSISGFAHEPGANFWGTPAVGDIDGDGIIELVIAARGNDTLYCWKIRDGNGDGKPDRSWAVHIGAISLGSPVIGNVDGTGNPEIVIMSEDGKVHIRNSNGTQYGTEPWKTTGGNRPYSTPALADLDSDGKMEVIVGGGDGKVYAWRYNGNSYFIEPYNTGRNTVSSPTVADVDGDGNYEIAVIAGDWNGDVLTNCKVLLLTSLGGPKLGGWNINGIPISNTSSGGCVFPSPAVGDLDGDSQLEIVVVTGSNVYAWRWTGTAVPGWPVSFSGTNSSPCIADIDGIEGQEVLAGSSDRSLHAWHANGTSVAGWPLNTGDVILATPAVGDIDGDGQYEVVCGSVDNGVYAWDTKGWRQKDWPMFSHDAAHTGCYGTIVSGTISSSRMWSGNVEIIGNLTINNNATLTVAAGTKILIYNNIKVDVASGSKIVANGTNANPIYFKRFNSSLHYDQIHLLGTGNQFSYCIFDGGNYADVFIQGGTGNSFSYCTFKNAGTFGVKIDGGSGNSFNRCSFVNNNTGVCLWYASGVSINQSNVSSNSGAGLAMYYCSMTYFTNNAVEGNGSNGIAVGASAVMYMGYGTGAYNLGSNPWSEVPTPGAGKNRVVNNGSYQIYVDATAQLFVGNLYLNGTYYLSQGFNRITSSNGNYIYNLAMTGEYENQQQWVVPAMKTYWGGGSPNPWNFYGSVDYSFYMSSDPSGGAGTPQLRVGQPGNSSEPAVVMTSSIATKLSAGVSTLSQQQSVVDLKNKMLELRHSLNDPKNSEMRPRLLSYLNSLRVFDPEDQMQEGNAINALLAEYRERLVSNRQMEGTDQLCSEAALVNEIQNAIQKGDNDGAWVLLKKYSSYVKNDDNRRSLLLAEVGIEERRGEYMKALETLEKVKAFRPDARQRRGYVEPSYDIMEIILRGNAKTAEMAMNAQQVQLIPTETLVLQNYPNPFNPSTVISYQLSVMSRVTLKVYDILGREVATLVDGMKEAGSYTSTFDGSRLSSGVYLTRFVVQPQAGRPLVQVKKMLMIK